MTIKVMHRVDRNIQPDILYEDVEEVVEACYGNGELCKQIIMKDGSTATYSVREWELWRRGWTRI